MQVVIEIPDKIKETIDSGQGEREHNIPLWLCYSIANGTLLPKGHGRLKDEDKIIEAIEDRVEFLRKNDAVFMRLRKDIDILGCIPKIRTEVPTIIEADEDSEE